MFLIWLLVGHFIGDFPMQSDWMVREKGRSWEVNFYHAATYTSVVVVACKIGGFDLLLRAILTLFWSHFLIDPLKARWGWIKQIWVDQLLHGAVLLVIYYFAI